MVFFALALMSIILVSVIRKTILAWRARTNFLTAKPADGNTVRAVAWSWLAPTGVMAVFVALSGGASREWERWYSAGPLSFLPPSVKLHDPPILADRLAKTPEFDATVDLPKWISDGDNTSGDVRRIVLSSHLWSTEAEANRELLPRAASIVRADFDQRHQSMLDRTGHNFLSDERVTDAAVKRRYIERVEQDFGAFSAPMCRLWLQIEVSPVVRTELYPAWKTAVVGNRVVAIGTVLALLTLAANATALVAGLKAVPHRSSTRVATVVACSVAAWIVGDLFVVMRLCQ